ncbi:MAG: ATP-dependent Clp protease ATP-binding subunit [Paludibacteraceae bacterium]|nr:ATP-dependent Clp protease ATP-binding subunit [Paludibacteraceae bacterium]
MDYTQHAHKVLEFAKQEAERLQNISITPEHLLLGICRLQESKAYELLCRSGVVLDELKLRLEEHLQTYTQSPNARGLGFSQATHIIVEMSHLEAESYQERSCGTAHILLAIMHHRANYPAMLLDNEYNVNYDTIERLYPHPADVSNDDVAQEKEDLPTEILSHLAGAGFVLLNGALKNGMVAMKNLAAGENKSVPQEEERKEEPKSETPLLDRYGRDLTQQAQMGLLDPIIGRQTEIQRLDQVLRRRRKNNPILIGEAGVGKTAIVEGLAQKWCNSRIEAVRHRRLIALDMAAIVAGASFRGEFEQRMHDIIEETRTHTNCILFIDEIHTIVGAGNTRGALDAASILKPALSRGEVQCIGSTTIAEYRQSIEKDAALERRFQKVVVEAPSMEESYAILQGLKSCYQSHHNKIYTDEAIRACVELSSRYLPDRELPDKAIDVMDEAGTHTIHTTITEDDIARVVSIMSGVPVHRVAKKEKEQLQQLPNNLKKRVIGQDKAIDQVVRAIRRSRLGLREGNRPIGTFFFMGATGVGKTYLSQCLAEELFGSRDAIIRFDMSEYMEKHAVSLLVGAPPGYIAHEDGGKLTEAVRRKPYSIVLFDEIEKAHPDIFNVLLQVLDEGRLTDRQGHSVDFRNTIIIMTSNVGTRQLQDFGAGSGFEAGQITGSVAEKVMEKALKKMFPPEFVNRIDDIITFQPLTKEHIEAIVRIELGHLRKRLAAQGYQFSLSSASQRELMRVAYDPKNGARPVKRAIQRLLEDKITDAIMNNPEMEKIRI